MEVHNQKRRDKSDINTSPLAIWGKKTLPFCKAQLRRPHTGHEPNFLIIQNYSYSQQAVLPKSPAISKSLEFEHRKLPYLTESHGWSLRVNPRALARATVCLASSPSEEAVLRWKVT